MSDGEEWVTIAEGAKRLGVSDRHAQRLATRLSEGDRRKSDRSPTSVRLTSLRQVHQQAREKTGRTDTGPTHVRPESDDPSPLVAHYEAEIAFLRGELVAQRENHHQAESELRRLMMADKNELLELRQKVALLLPPAPAESNQDAPGSPQERETGRQEETTARRPWWHLWK